MPARSRFRCFFLAAPLALALLGLLLAPDGDGKPLAADPAPRATAAFQTTDHLVLTVALPSAREAPGRGTLAVVLLGPDGKVLARKERAARLGKVPSLHRFQLDALKVPAETVTVRCVHGTRQAEVPLRAILLVKAHETVVSASTDLFAGSTAALRCEVRGVRSLTQTVPLAGASVIVRLRPGSDGKLGRALYRGKAGPDGVADVRFQVPEVRPGSYTLQVETRSDLGEEKLERAVQVKSETRVLLTADKPLYQPGQTIHLRALALRAFDLRPSADAVLTFEVEDGKGNKVFKRQLKTSAYGIAATDFTLADEVNAGDYRLRVRLGSQQAERTVGVRPYVLPKFKAALQADKAFYLPGETLKAELQADYFFGKPVAGAQVEVRASTFDVAVKEFASWKGKTDATGHARFALKLPASLVGLPLAKGNAVVRLEAQVTDTAEHSETANRSWPVSDRPIQVSLLPEGGRLVPGLPNRLFAAALYPDGSPARCSVEVWAGRVARDKPIATLKTNEAGLAELRLTPRPEQFRRGAWGPRPVEMLGGTARPAWDQANYFDLTARARDERGNEAGAAVTLTAEPLGENVLLRLDRAVYQGGERLRAEVHSSAGLPTAYLDVLKDGQTLLTKWLEVKDGKAEAALDLPAGAFGTLEVHAYQVLRSGEVLRDSRLVYVSPASSLKVAVRADQEEYRPGGAALLRFEVSDAAGKPTPAALGVLVVDEAVYALQEMQPGLEKVFFTLQQELLKPSAQVVFKPAEGLDALVRRRSLPEQQQQVARALLGAVRPRVPQRWQVDPAVARLQKGEEQLQRLGAALFDHALAGKPVLRKGRLPGSWVFRPKVLDELAKARKLPAEQLLDPVGGKFTVAELTRLEKGFTADGLARAVTRARISRLRLALASLANSRRAEWFKDGRWVFPATALADAARHQKLDPSWLADGWGRPLELVKRSEKSKGPVFAPLAGHEIVSAGPDRRIGTKDDVHYGIVNQTVLAQTWWLPEGSRLARAEEWRLTRRPMFGRGGAPGMVRRPTAARGKGMGKAKAKAGARPAAKGRAKGPAPGTRPAPRKRAKTEADAPAGGEPGPAPPRLREYFPETLLWQPALLTDERGRAELRVPLADSITTWRLSASASSLSGLLGGTAAPVRVFQDFFCDLDLPVALTANDEVAFPVAVYNYLKVPQRVTLELQKEGWFDLVDGAGFRRVLDVKPGAVAALRFRIRARRVGRFPLTVTATGTKLADAQKRTIEVLPDGQKVEQVFTDRLQGTVRHTFTVPGDAIADASRLLVKVYPGVLSQVLEGTEGLLRLPGG
jgi:hypothetical protein